MNTHNIQFHDKIRNFPLIFVFLSYRKKFVGTKKRVRISHGKRAIGVRAIEFLLTLRTPYLPLVLLVPLPHLLKFSTLLVLSFYFRLHPFVIYSIFIFLAPRLQFFFVRTSFIISLFEECSILICSTFCPSGRLCFVIVPFQG